MKFLSKLMMLFLLSSCSYLDNTPEDLTWRTFPEEWQGYYQSSSGLYGSYLTKEFKVSADYIIFKHYDSSSTDYNDEDRFSTYQKGYSYITSDDVYRFHVCQAYKEQDDIPWGDFGFKKSGEDVIVYYYYNSYRYESATYKKSSIPFE